MWVDGGLLGGGRVGVAMLVGGNECVCVGLRLGVGLMGVRE